MADGADAEELQVQQVCRSAHQLVVLDENNYAFAGSRAMVVSSLDGSTTKVVQSTAAGPVSAIAAVPQAQRYALAAVGQHPAVQIYSLPGHELVGQLHGAASVEYHAVAMSQTGSRVITFSDDDGFGAVAWDVASQSILPGAVARCPDRAEQASFSPVSEAQACSSGRGGLFFWHLRDRAGQWELHSVPATLPDEAVPARRLARFAAAAAAGTPVDEAAGADEEQAAATDTAASSAAPKLHTGLPDPPAAAAQGLAFAGRVASGQVDAVALSGALPTPDVADAIESSASGAAAARTSPSRAAAGAGAPSPVAAAPPGGAQARGLAAAGLAVDSPAGSAQRAGLSALLKANGGATLPEPEQRDDPLRWAEVAAADGARSWTLRRRWTCHSWTSDGRVVVAGNEAGWIARFDPVSGKCVGARVLLKGEFPTSMCLVASGTLAVGMSDGSIRFVDPSTCHILRTARLPLAVPRPDGPLAVLPRLGREGDPTDPLASVPAEADAQEGAEGGAVDAAPVTARAPGALSTTAATAAAAALLAREAPADVFPDGAVAALWRGLRGGASGKVAPICPPGHWAGSVTALAASQAGDWVVASTDKGAIFVSPVDPHGPPPTGDDDDDEAAAAAHPTDWSAQQHRDAHAGVVVAARPVCQSACGPLVMSVSSDATVRLWDPSTGRERGCRVLRRVPRAGLAPPVARPAASHLTAPALPTCLDTHPAAPIAVVGDADGALTVLAVVNQQEGGGGDAATYGVGAGLPAAPSDLLARARSVRARRKGSGQQGQQPSGSRRITMASVGLNLPPKPKRVEACASTLVPPAPDALSVCVGRAALHDGAVTAAAILPAGVPLVATVSAADGTVVISKLQPQAGAPLEDGSITGGLLAPAAVAKLPVPEHAANGDDDGGNGQTAEQKEGEQSDRSVGQAAAPTALAWRYSEDNAGTAELWVGRSDGSILVLPVDVVGMAASGPDHASRAEAAALRRRHGDAEGGAGDAWVSAHAPTIDLSDQLYAVALGGPLPVAGVAWMGPSVAAVVSPSSAGVALLKPTWALGAPAPAAGGDQDRSLQELGTLPGHSSGVLCVAAALCGAPAGGRVPAALVSGGADGSALAWSVEVALDPSDEQPVAVHARSGAATAGAGGVSAVALAPSASGSLAISAGDGAGAVAFLASGTLRAPSPPSKAALAAAGPVWEAARRCVGVVGLTGALGPSVAALKKAHAAATQAAVAAASKAMDQHGRPSSPSKLPAAALAQANQRLEATSTASAGKGGGAAGGAGEHAVASVLPAAVAATTPEAAAASSSAAGIGSSSAAAADGNKRTNYLGAASAAKLQELVSFRAAAEHGSALTGELRQKLAGIRRRLEALLAANEEAPELERLDRSDFAVDDQGVGRAKARWQEASERRRAELERMVAAAERQAAAVVTGMHEHMEHHDAVLRTLGSRRLDAPAFAIPKLTDRQRRRLDRATLLRRVEQQELREDPEGAARPADRVGGEVWRGLSDDFPGDLSWVLFAGLLPPSLQPSVRQLQEAMKQQAAAKGRRAAAAAKARDEDHDDEANEEDEAGAGGAEEEEAEAAVDEGVTGLAASWEGEGVLKLLYHPTACRTPMQRRLQLVLLEALARGLMQAYNKQWDELRVEKKEMLSQIAEKNRELKQIVDGFVKAGGRLEDLVAATVTTIGASNTSGRAGASSSVSADGTIDFVTAAADAVAGAMAARPAQRLEGRPASAEHAEGATAEERAASARSTARSRIRAMGSGRLALYEPALLPEEDPEALLAVTDAEVGVDRFVTPEERAAMEAEEAARREAEANRDDAPERALVDMMWGTLEAADELTKLEESLVREPWMDELLPEQMSPEQREKLVAYEERKQLLHERRAAVRQQLEAEFRKGAGDIRDAIAHFDAKVAAMRTVYVEHQQSVWAVELLAHRLGERVASRDANLEREAGMLVRMDDLATAYMQSSEQLQAADAAIEKAHRDLEELRKEGARADRQVRDAVRAALEPTAGASTAPLLALFKAGPPPLPVEWAPVGAETLDGGGAVVPVIAARTAEQIAAANNGGHPRAPTPEEAAQARREEALAEASQAALAAGSGRMLTAAEEAELIGLTPELRAPALGHDAPPSALASLRLQLRRRSEEQHLAERSSLVRSQDLPDDLQDEEQRRAVAEVLSRWRRQEAHRAVRERRAAATLRQLLRQRVAVDATMQRVARQREVLFSERAQLLQANALAGNDLDVVVAMPQGKDEVTGAVDVNVDFSNAVLVPTRVVERENKRIRRAAAHKVARLRRVRDHRARLRYMQWEAQLVRAMQADAVEHFSDVQLLRVTKDLQSFIKGGDLAAEQRAAIVRAERQAAYLRNAHKRTLAKLRTALGRVERQLKAKEAENQQLAEQTVALGEVVEVREAIQEARLQAAGGPAAGGGAVGGGSGVAGASAGTMRSTIDPTARARDAFEKVSRRSKLSTLVKQQAHDIEALTAEFEKLKRRTFPLFDEQTVGEAVRSGVLPPDALEELREQRRLEELAARQQ